MDGWVGGLVGWWVGGWVGGWVGVCVKSLHTIMLECTTLEVCMLAKHLLYTALQ